MQEWDLLQKPQERGNKKAPPIDGASRAGFFTRLDIQLCDACLYVGRRFIQCGLFIGCQLDLYDLFHSVLSNLDRDAAVDIREALLPLEPGGTGQNSLLVTYDRLDHFDRAR